MGEPAPAYALLRCPPDRIRCACSEHDDDEQGGNGDRVGPARPEVHPSIVIARAMARGHPIARAIARRRRRSFLWERRRSRRISMFAPPICRRRWRNNAFPFRQIRRRRRQPSEHRRERSEQSNRARRAREAPKKVGGCRPSRYAKRAPVDQHPPGSRPQPSHSKRDRLESPSTAGLAPKGRLTYLEHCGKCATTNSRRTMSDSLRRPT